jgi:iron-sulfur cluster protein
MSTALRKRVADGIENRPQRLALGAAMRRARESRASVLSTLPDPDAFREGIKRIKEGAIGHLRDLLEQFTDNARKNGVIVYFAKDADAAIEYISTLARAKNARLIAKSKSLTTEEIELNQPLERIGCEVVETDLGERIIQLAHEKPIHLVMPAAHKTVQQVAELFSAHEGRPISAEYGELLNSVRASLRKTFLDADVGISGVNVAVAETGTIVIETNEGNARLVTALPRTHIALMGVEKIVPTVEDALQLIQAHPIAATGQKLTTYVSFITGRAPLKGEAEERELHIVILDNGRSTMNRDDDFRESLYCIRCGACMNICPTYEVVGGHVFGYVYPGPIGIPWTANVHGLNKADYADLCIACGLCREICPADIDIPYMIARVKELKKEKHGQPFVNRVVMASDELAKLASITAPVSNWILNRKSARYLMEKLLGIDRRRKLPPFSSNTFQNWWSNHKSAAVSPTGRAAYFVDLYANYNRSDIGIGAVNLLEKCRVSVAIPPQKTSGMPYFSYGELDRLKSIAEYNVASMLPYVEKGYEVVATEPTAAYCFKEIYPKTLKTKESALVAEHSHEYSDYLSKRGEIANVLGKVFSGRAGLHVSCHQRALTGGKGMIQLMNLVGVEVEVIETGTCCGMGGTFGLKSGPLGYDLSSEVGQPLFQLFRDAKIDLALTESSVCTINLEQGANIRIEHPIALLAAALEGKSGNIKQLFEH